MSQQEPKQKKSFHLFKLKATETEEGYLDRIPWFQFILLSLLFPLWAAAASLNDILITQFKTVFTLSNFASAFVQSAFYGGYFLIAMPASNVIKKTSYKFTILVGLLLYTIGCSLFFPASHVATYSIFLVAIFAIAIGLSFLETAANTYSSLLGPKETSTLRLNISQTFYPIGAVSGILLGKYLIFSEGASLEEQMKGLTGTARIQFGEEMLQKTLLPYKFIIIILIVMMILFALTEFPKSKPKTTTNEKDAKISETLAYLAKNKEFLKGIGTQFMYIGMQTAVWSFTIRLAMSLDPSINERSASTYMVFSFIAFFLGKMLANFLMKKISPSKVLFIFSILGSLSLLYIMFVHNMSAVYFTILVSGLFGPCWATIYSQTLDTVTDKRHTATAGAIIVMSIIGGAVIPLIQGLVADWTGSMSLSFVVSLVCFIVVIIYSKNRMKKEA
ncbi:L-fucose:H+ symporter permease [Vagococcus intermedius]|uniref:L-fucose:H+ symporter permease n=1 Tax=Vagococcus intermedius TaxID=2991418 RepID=A0AAF0I7L9_9ENTE|nr:L-fucose:H+ symporter permease [Vagococcus intermedius]WEG73470.1 L-fucose:H+ symporter permease [Vagococcus intermedius]WEG75553.1 L-fucose:H+ symporter permease [Vagococcus intermedius]